MAQDFGPNWQSIESEDEGGQSHVFTASRAGDSSGKRYVIKRLKNLDRVERFERELDTIRRLAHPNILALVDSGFDKKGRPFIVTELCEGRNLAKSDTFDKTTDIQKLGIFCQICRAVEHAHSEGVIHRDIKPENILLRDIDHPVLGDFGIVMSKTAGTLR